MYKVSHSIATIKLSDYIKNYRDVGQFIVYCKKCNRYNTCWSCPPFEFNEDEYISSYKTVYVIGTKIILDKGLIKNNTGREACTKISYNIIAEVRPELDESLLKLEEQYPESRAFFAGTCHICQPENCTRIKGEPCIAPEKIRPSLEAFGFDIGKTSLDLLNIEMKWSVNGNLPEYFTLVSGLFTNQAKCIPFRKHLHIQAIPLSY